MQLAPVRYTGTKFLILQPEPEAEPVSKILKELLLGALVGIPLSIPFAVAVWFMSHEA